jgi:hypothetical protein
VSNHAQAREWTTEGNGKQQAGKIVRAMLWMAVLLKLELRRLRGIDSNLPEVHIPPG